MNKITLLIISLFSCFQLVASSTKEHIICINSYAESYPWSNRIISELIEYSHDHLDLTTSIEHMRLPLSSNSFDIDLFENRLIQKYGTIQPKAVVVIGMSAYSLRDTYRKLWGDVPILLYSSRDYVADNSYYFTNNFVPITDENRIPVKKILKDYNTTLFYTNLFLKESVDYIKYRHPNLERIIFLRGDRQMNKDLEFDLEKIIAANYPSIELQPIFPSQTSTIDLIQILNQVDRNSTAILYASWFNIISSDDGEIIDNNTNLLVSTCKTPIYTLNLSDITTFEGRMHSGVSFDFEKLAAAFREALGKVIYAGIEPRNIESYYPVKPQPYVLCNVAFSRGLTYADFPPNTVFLNPPAQLIKRFDYTILCLTIFSALCVCIIGVLSFYLIQSKKRLAKVVVREEG